MNNNDIEENIEKLERVIKLAKQTGLDKTLALAIENILADRERLEKENTEMQVEIAEQVYFGSMPIEEEKELQVKANKYDSLAEKIKEVRNSLEKDGFVGYADELMDILEEEQYE